MSQGLRRALRRAARASFPDPAGRRPLAFLFISVLLAVSAGALGRARLQRARGPGPLPSPRGLQELRTLAARDPEARVHALVGLGRYVLPEEAGRELSGLAVRGFVVGVPGGEGRFASSEKEALTFCLRAALGVEEEAAERERLAASTEDRAWKAFYLEEAGRARNLASALRQGRCVYGVEVEAAAGGLLRLAEGGRQVLLVEDSPDALVGLLLRPG